MSKITAHARNANIILFIFMLILLMGVTSAVVTGLTGTASENLARFYSIEAVNKFALYISEDLALVRKVSRSAAVTSWFADEDNQEKRLAAYQEMMDYAGILHSAELYFGILRSLNEFSVESGATLEDFVPYDQLDPDIIDNIWFFETVAMENDYNLNIDIDKFSQRWRLWINHKVVYNGEVVGVFCSGLRIDTILTEMFEHYDEGNVRGFVIDRNGIIQFDSADYDFHLVDAEYSILEKNHDPAFTRAITNYLKNIDGLFTATNRPEVIKLSRGPYGFVSIAPISHSDWSVVTFFNNNSLFSVTQLLPLLFIMLAAFILYALAGNAIINRLSGE